jgi:hypothetical protein
MAGSWKTGVGLNHVGAYQVSGVPFASGSIDCKAPSGGFEVVFPYVSRWFQVINKDLSNDCRVGFSALGVVGTNYFTVAKGDADASGHGVSSGILELKVSSIFISGSLDVDIVAGLTKIERESTTTTTGANWSGSSGVG